MGFCRESIEDMIGVEMASASLYLESHGSASPQLNYNAIAQGYSCDLVARYLYSIGVKDMMVNIGEIFCDGKNPSGVAWTIGIDRPEDGNNELGAQLQGVFSVPEGPHGVVTSGNYRKFYVKDGKKYAHTIDPRTGYPVTHNLLSATIIAENAMVADAYATYCMVIGLEQAKAFIESRDDLEGCLIYDDEGEFVTWCSAGLETRKAM
jgi:thiamine biosynthesis lipoprotein